MLHSRGGAVVAALLIAFLAALTAACGDRPSFDAHLQNAERAIKQGDSAGAHAELESALSLDPGSPYARLLLGRLHFDSDDAAAGYRELGRALELGWSADDILPEQARALLGMRQFKKVLALPLDDLGDAAEAAVLASQSRAALSLGDVKQARQLVTAARDLDPDGSVGNLAMATLLLRTDEQPAALRLLGRTAESDPENPRVWYNLGLARQNRKQLLGALHAFERAAELNPLWVDANVGRALTNLSLDRVEEAGAQAARLISTYPDSPAANYLQGLLNLRAGDYRAVIRAHTRAQPLAQDFPMINYALGRAYFLTGYNDDARSFATQYFEQAPDNVDGRKLLAALELRRGNYQEAHTLLEPVLDQNPVEVESLHMSALALAHAGDLDESLSQYTWLSRLSRNKLLTIVPESSELVAAALKVHTDAARNDGSEQRHPEDKLLEVLGYLQQREYDWAITVASDMQMSDTAELFGHHILAKVYLAADRKKEAIATARAALKQAPHDPVSNLLLADLAKAEKKPRVARQHFNQVLEQEGYHLPTLMRFAALEQQQGNVHAFLARTLQATRAHPTAIGPRINLASHYLSIDRAWEVAEVFAPLSELQRRAPRIYSLELLAQLATGKNALEEATVKALLALQPGSEAFYYRLAGAAQQVGRLKETQDALREHRSRNSRHLGTVVGLARAAQLNGKRQQLVGYTGLLTKSHPNPDMPVILRLRAAAAAHMGDLETAIALTASAFQQTPQAALLADLTRYQIRGGQIDAAMQALQAWLAERPEDIGLQLRLAQLLDSIGDMKGATAVYKEILAQDSKHIIALNNLAWLLREEKPEQALKLIERANGLAPNQADILDSLAVIQYINREPMKAMKSIRAALQLQPGNPTMQFHQAIILASLGKPGMAIDTLRTLLARGENSFPEYTMARALLNSLEG